jgi:hypothetical protein
MGPVRAESSFPDSLRRGEHSIGGMPSLRARVDSLQARRGRGRKSFERRLSWTCELRNGGELKLRSSISHPAPRRLICLLKETVQATIVTSGTII